MKTTSTWWKILLSGLLLAGTLVAYADAYQPSYSTAGFYQLSNTGRTAYSMNPAWRFYKGHIEGAEQPEFNDKDWNIVSLPDGIEYLPTEASGCINYQGEIWYRKHFTPEESWKGKQQFLHFEAIMGKSKIWVNGKLLKEHFGGFLPVIVDVTSSLKYGEDNVITVWKITVDDPDHSCYYIHPETATVRYVNSTARWKYWMYTALHRLRIQGLNSSPTLRKSVLWVLLLGGTVCSLSGVVLGVRYIERKCRKKTRR